MIKWNRLSAVVAILSTALCIAKSAGAVDLRDWGKKYATSERFVVLEQFNNEAVLDKETQLVWQAIAAPIPATQTWSQAYTACHVTTTGGRRGWRLPTYAEMSSALAPGSTKPPALNGVPDGQYWTATAAPDLYGNVMSIWFASGNYGGQINKSAQLRFWCVRGPT